MSDEVRVREETGERAAAAGAAVAGESFRASFEVETKDGKTDFVTNADRDAQRAVIDVIESEFPDDAIVGEEDDELKAVPETGACWVIDPIDGTNNYVRGIREFATSVAAVVDGETVAAATVMPALGDTYLSTEGAPTRNGRELAVSSRSDPETCVVCPTVWWDFDRRDEYAVAVSEVVERFADLRRFGCAQGALGRLAAGAIDGVFTNVDANPWDTMAGVHLVRQAGGTVTDLEGDRWTHDATGLVASNGEIHDAVLAAAQAIPDP
jgi:myo-inositol-1(or 4)-monophosphatase